MGLTCMAANCAGQYFCCANEEYQGNIIFKSINTNLILEGEQFSEEESQLISKIDNLMIEMEQPNHYKAALNTLRLRVQLKKFVSSPKFIKNFSNQEKESMYEYLLIQNNAISSLQNQIHQIKQTLNTVSHAIHEGALNL